MPEQTKKYEILVAVDGSPESDAAVRWATREAELRQLPITLVHVVVPVVTSWPVRSLQAEFNEWQEDNARQVLEQAQKMLRSTLGDVRAAQRAYRGATRLRSACAGRALQSRRR